MNTTNLILGLVILIAIAAVIILFLTRKQQIHQPSSAMVGKNKSFSQQLQLQAYERLALLVDRIAMPNLISRVNEPGISAKDMQFLLTQHIKQEFDHNITQQIYVSANAWNAVKNLKEQNQLLINQLANTLPVDATGLDLNKLLLEYLMNMNNTRGSLHELVSEVLSYEAKTVL